VSKHAVRLLNHPEPANGNRCRRLLLPEGSSLDAARRQTYARAEEQGWRLGSCFWRMGGARRRAGRDSLSLRRTGITSVVRWLVVSDTSRTGARSDARQRHCFARRQTGSSACDPPAPLGRMRMSRSLRLLSLVVAPLPMHRLRTAESARASSQVPAKRVERARQRLLRPTNPGRSGCAFTSVGLQSSISQPAHSLPV
jgi:hypothetical protein